MSESNNGTSVALARPKGEIAALLERKMEWLAPFLPEGVKPERVIAAAQIAANENEDIAKCDGFSVVKSVARIMSWGGEIGQNAYLVPFKDNKKGILICTPIAGYQLLIDLMYASGAISGHKAKAVFEGDDFHLEFGIEDTFRHKPKWSARQGGKVQGAYCIVYMRRQSRPIIEYMTAEEIDAIRTKLSKQWKNGELKDWYAIKTVIRRISKQIPRDPRLAKFFDAIEQDEAAELVEEIVIGPDELEHISPAQPAAAPQSTERQTSIDPDWLINGASESDEAIREEDRRILEREQAAERSR